MKAQTRTPAQDLADYLKERLGSDAEIRSDSDTATLTVPYAGRVMTLTVSDTGQEASTDAPVF